MIKIHNEEDFEGMRKAGRLAADLLDYIEPFVVPGVTTNYLNDLCEKWTQEHNAWSGPLNYKGFPKSICSSVNHSVCHEIPSDRILKNGDIINIDVTPVLNDYYGDSSKTFFVGNKISIKARRLVEITYKAMMAGIATIHPGSTIGDIGHAISTVAHSEGFSVVHEYCGHGIGKGIFHTQPSVLHIGKPGEGLVIEKGWIFTVEPMVNEGKAETKLLADKWVAVTRDRKLSAQFEHTIGVTENGCEIFTLSQKERNYL